jgi:hypothetical protein
MNIPKNGINSILVTICGIDLSLMKNNLIYLYKKDNLFITII